jgi:multidrug resistance efflux pump
MKSEYFNKRSQTTQLRGHREKPKPKQINWDRIVYFILLVLALGFLFYYIFINSFYVSGEGLVVTETMKVRAPSDIEIREQLVSKDSYVEKGDPLFEYVFMNWTGTIEEIEDIQENITELQEDIEELQDDVTLKRQDIQEIEGRIAYLEQQRNEFLEKVRLNAATSYELDEVESSLFTARSNLRQAQSELNVLMNNLNRHIQRRESLEAEVQEFRLRENGFHTYYSPVSGIVQNISIRDNQQAFRSDQILSIKPNNADVYIFSVFDREDAGYTQPGTTMNIEFDNGLESVGIVRNSYDARENLIDHFEQTGSLTTEYLVVELVPADSATRSQWLQLDRTGLSVFKRKVGGNEVTDANRSTSNEIGSSDGTGEQRLLQETESDSVESSQLGVSNPAPTPQQESVETTTPSDLNTNANNVEYGLQGETFYDQLEGYAIILYSLEDLERATEISDNIKSEGYRVDVHPVTISNKEFWRVAVGQFRTIEDALAAAETLPASVGKEYFIHRIQ